MNAKATPGATVRIPDVTAHFEHARACGAEILQPPVDDVYGERQDVVRDIGGHRWTFSQTLADSYSGDGAVRARS